MRKILLTLLLLTFTCPAGAAELIITRDAVLKQAVQQNPAYRSSVEESYREFYYYLSSYSGFLPTVSLGYDATNTKSREGFFVDKYYTVSGAMNIFNGFKTYSSVRSAFLNSDNYEYARKQSYLELVKNVYLAYHQVLKNQYLMNSSYSLFESADLVLKEAQEKQALDMLTKSDLYKAMADREKAYSGYLDAETAYSTSLLEINALSGVEVDGLTVFLPVEEAYIIRSLEDYTQAALSHNLSLKQAENNSKISSLSYGSSYGDFLPSVDLKAYSRWNNQEKYNQNMIGLSITFDVFSGFSSLSATLAKARDVNSSDLKAASAKTQLIKQVKSLWLTALSNDKKVKSAELYVRSAEENYTATMEMFRIGRATLKDTIDARATLQDAQTTLASAAYSQVENYTDLMVATGGYYYDDGFEWN